MLIPTNYKRDKHDNHVGSLNAPQGFMLIPTNDDDVEKYRICTVLMPLRASC